MSGLIVAFTFMMEGAIAPNEVAFFMFEEKSANATGTRIGTDTKTHEPGNLEIAVSCCAVI